MKKNILNDFEKMEKEDFNKLQQIMLPKHYVMKSDSDESVKNIAYYNAYLLSNFGIEVTNPKELTKETVKEIADYFKLNVPASFYKNPQDLKYFTKEELLIEQLVSYFVIAIEGTHNEDTHFDRIEIFKKNLPEYTEGDDIKTRKFTVVTKQEALEIGKKIEKNYCDYTRPFGIDEKAEFIFLYDLGLYDGSELKCRDNIFGLLDKDINFAKGLDRKDVVKYSKEQFGENKATFKNLPEEKLEIFKQIIPLVKTTTPLSRQQAKMFNKICKECKINIRESNEKSPYRLAKNEMDKGNVMGATEIFARNGSLLERNLVYLLSRANPKEQVEIIDKLSDKNPIVLYQLAQMIDKRDNSGRTFTFAKNNVTKTHIETEKEAKYSKTHLTEGTAKFIKDELIAKIEKHYQNGEKLNGKVYISPEFEKVALPVNTTASGKGLDVLPIGSRTEIRGDYIRTFCYWNNVYDIDASALFLKGNFKDTKRCEELSWRNYHTKPFGESALTSGDCRNRDGSEYQDFKISELKELGYKYAVYTINGWGGKLDKGEIFVGYQDKSNLNTKAWDPKNIEFRINVKGDTREYTGFAIDLDTKEIITLNLNIAGNDLVCNPKQFQAVEKYFDPSYLETMNMAKIIKARAVEIVDNPKDADIVFDRDYTPTEKQVAIRPFDVDSLVSIINDGQVELPEDKSEESEKTFEVRLMDSDGNAETREIIEGKEYTLVSHAGDLILLEGNASKDEELQEYISNCYGDYLDAQASFVATKENADAISSSSDSMEACYSVNSSDCEIYDDVE